MGVVTGQALLHQKLQLVAPVPCFGRRYLGNFQPGQRLAVVVAANFTAAHLVAEFLAFNRSLQPGPGCQQVTSFFANGLDGFVVALGKNFCGGVFGQAFKALQLVGQNYGPKLTHSLVIDMCVASLLGTLTYSPVQTAPLLG